jgi:hypothetical protein
MPTSPGVLHFDTKEVIDAAIEKLRLEHLDRMIADIEAGWKHVTLSEEEEEELELAWETMKSYARAWRLKRESYVIIRE